MEHLSLCLKLLIQQLDLVTAEEEIAGLDATEHGTSAYGDFITKK